ncbi:imidazole glycerol phosphate synthase subunit HisH [Prochlorococcus sp. MIT 1306]|uniref:imidazole glycerol phosphate synthase subunit HisH n=1 Tax=Prochlorococcus sp. MIT 1306 TaxID=1799667 RepID=UPI0007B36C8F|nr:imidazole glycerol phosphate synthase subunit HisH [Prochlorococcus sp. MIT 1306]KZR61079.1 Imidazole glycerol phosphate synthase subunit HisF [Prochlorococcus sp. MIT 1306]
MSGLVIYKYYLLIMTLQKRILARLDIKGSRLIKGVRFEGLRVIGDPHLAAINYTNFGVDEILYIDAVASLYGRNSLYELLRQTSHDVFIPITAGGGIRSVHDAASLLAVGADKVAINTAAHQNPGLISQISKTFGSQSVVASVQARKIGNEHWEAMAEAGRERTGKSVIEWIEFVQDNGAGEILLTSVDQDGTCLGPDNDLIISAGSVAKIPLIYGGGLSKDQEIIDCLKQPNIMAVSIATALHKQIINVQGLKDNIKSSSPELPIRNPVLTHPRLTKPQLKPKLIGIIDYNMGNQQSLINAFQKLGYQTLLSNTINKLEDCDLLALPGVGSFPKAMSNLTDLKLDKFLANWINHDRPLIGICLGMQLLFQQGDEFEFTKGLGFIDGDVRLLSSLHLNIDTLKLPHIGWNNLISTRMSANLSSFEGISQYFVHSYVASNVKESEIIFNCEYDDVTFVAGVRKKSIAGFQFHPERSGLKGLELLQSMCYQLLERV